MAKKVVQIMVPCAIPRKRAEFPSLDNVLDSFILDNNLPEPKTVVSTDSRGLLVHCGNGDYINVFGTREDLSAYDQQVYGLQGRIDGENVILLGEIMIPNCEEWHGKKLKKQVHSHTYNPDSSRQYVFLGVKAIPPPDPMKGILR